MKLLPLTNGTFAQIDDEDFERLSKYKWTDTNAIERTTVEFSVEYIPAKGWKYKTVSLAQDIMQNYNVLWDHKDRNKYNNQKENIRECNKSQNSANSNKQENCTSKYKGVSWHKGNKKWRAYISRRKYIHLGQFDTEEDAAKEYDKKALEIYKEFAVLNFPNNQ